jgi:ferredoxin
MRPDRDRRRRVFVPILVRFGYNPTDSLLLHRRTMPAVRIDTELCIGSGECVRTGPDAFAIDETLGVAVVLDGARRLPADLVARAVAGCPLGAIAVATDDPAAPLRGTE